MAIQVLTPATAQQQNEHLLMLTAIAMEGPRAQAFLAALSSLLELVLTPEEVLGA